MTQNKAGLHVDGSHRDVIFQLDHTSASRKLYRVSTVRQLRVSQKNVDRIERVLKGTRRTAKSKKLYRISSTRKETLRVNLVTTKVSC